MDMENTKIVSEDCVEFYNIDEKLCINLVPISRLPSVPRVGETVMLPGESREDRGPYQVVSVTHMYVEETEAKEQPTQARLIKISVGVRRKSN